MKYLWLLFILILTSSCGNKNEDKIVESLPEPTDTLDYLLDIKNEAELIDKFGKNNVSWDTVFGAEGAVSMATLIYPGTINQIEVVWKNMKKKSGMEKVTLTAFYDTENEKLITKTRWKTSYGITLGTTLSELEKMNEVPFIFYGFGWDFGGIVSEFNKGKLSKLPVSIQIGITDIIKQGNDPDYEMLMGDNEYNSNDPEAQRLNPVVTSISVIKKLKTQQNEECNE